MRVIWRLPTSKDPTIGLIDGRRDTVSHLKQLPGKENRARRKWRHHGNKPRSRPFCPTKVYQIFTMQMNSDYFIRLFPVSHSTSNPIRCVGAKDCKIRLTVMDAANAAGDKLPMFVIEKSAKASMSSLGYGTFHAYTEHKRRVGWIAFFLRSG